MGTKQPVTIRDVAADVGVSRQTVSRVLNKGPNVKPAVRARVEESMERLGYVPNISARRMRGSRSYLILAINDRQRTYENWRAGRGNDWVDQMLFGGMTECERQGYHLVFELIDTQPEKAQGQLSKVISELRPDGVILTPPHSDNATLTDLLEEFGIACARIGRRDGGAFVDVCMDEAGAGFEAARHLADLDHTRIAYLAGSPYYGNSLMRVDGYRDLLCERGLPYKEDWIGKGEFNFDTAIPVVQAWLEQEERPTAIIADNDQMAFAVLHVADRLGIGVPQDLSLVSLEDTPGVRLSVPPMTAIRQPTAAMIAKACSGLISESSGSAAGGRYELPFELIRRESTARLK
ncbi:LacI family transcriptional regulator [Erythrobacter longus]|uniref:LacI family transcriptional regulator n=1 Tax=Erythrobacter longus TaxID=1044 RepID=A0A074MB94_ERYLO|nr:LacI family DNA-binding transcriptional regulator [Erythrobacter longus]KEO92081.1 LacI family transcriptional regulator [Erythrobacter longus]